MLSRAVDYARWLLPTGELWMVLFVALYVFEGVSFETAVVFILLWMYIGLREVIVDAA